MKLTINKDRLKQHFEVLSQIGKIGDTGVCRPALSKEEKEAFHVVTKWMEEAGMTVRIDHFGNLIGRLEGKNPQAPVLMIGSHLDSQPYGGRFDGVAGVLAGIETAKTLTEKEVVSERPIEVISFCDEEGWRFNKGLFGSRGILGKLEKGELDRKDKDGMTRKEALIEFGCDPNRFSACVYEPNDIHCFLELHIEQGPILDKANEAVGVVSGIAGPLWLTVTLKGYAGHAGSVPMNMRKDALVGAAEVILSLNEIAKRIPGAPTVGTVGNLTVFPNSRNIIPEEVSFTVDLRDLNQNRRKKYEKELCEVIEKAAGKNSLTFSIREDTNSEPRYCADWIKDIMHEKGKEIGMKTRELMSGPFHDALALSYACDYGMIFVRCKDGISHNPAEFASYDDLALGTELMYRVAADIARRPIK
ncbi:Zn-dependent hydrolase [Bacillus taeanensis]|uniref:Zn-dependent hydrolase n=1 Tax=Bacillus taeanensis TaxID=273032 RepID=A0A366XZK0_9BACI|nr:Zn-dependent hydrolase [Bacillus taeanensis]RBW70998.1 Zn-dependent hydrolase [Bacillus taeanensis]